MRFAMLRQLRLAALGIPIPREGPGDRGWWRISPTARPPTSPPAPQAVRRQKRLRPPLQYVQRVQVVTEKAKCYNNPPSRSCDSAERVPSGGFGGPRWRLGGEAVSLDQG